MKNASWRPSSEDKLLLLLRRIVNAGQMRTVGRRLYSKATKYYFLAKHQLDFLFVEVDISAGGADAEENSVIYGAT